MRENNTGKEQVWWKERDFIKKLDADYKDWKSGKAKAYSLEEVNISIEQLRFLNEERRKHLNGESRSYRWEEVKEMIRKRKAS